MSKQVNPGGVKGVCVTWLIAIVIQGILTWAFSYYLMHSILTEDNFNAWTSNQSEGTKNFFGHWCYLIGTYNQIVASTVIFFIVSVVVALFKVIRGWDEKFTDIMRNILIAFGAIALLFNIAGISWWWVGLFLAECVPLWGGITLVLNLFNNPILGDGYYHNKGDYQRGARLVDPRKSDKAFDVLTKKETVKGEEEGITIWNDKAIPRSRETQHCFIVGTSGTGKTQIIYPMTEKVYMRPGDKAVIWDKKGTYTQAWVGKPKVDLLAYWDKRSIAWLPSAEIHSKRDCHELAEIIIPANNKELQPFFRDTARRILEAVLIYLFEQGTEWGWGDLYDILCKPRKELALLLSSTSSGRLVVNDLEADGKSLNDVFGTLNTVIDKNIRWYAEAWPRKGVSLKKWIDGKSKFLIIGGVSKYSAMAQSTADIAIQLIVREILSLSDDPNRRIWFFLDELGTLENLKKLIDAFTQGRSKGICVVAGIQDLGQLKENVGDNLAQTIANVFSTMIILRCTDPMTSKWVSEILGEQEVIETQTSKSVAGNIWEGQKTTESKQNVLRVKKMYLPSEIAHFKDLNGVIRVSGWPLLRVEWQGKKIPQDSPLIEEA